VPIPHKSKGPVIVRWQDLRISHETALRYFNSATQNIGVILGPASGGLTDVDLDCPEVIGLASYFLPRTDAIFGRASKRNSHWLYVTRLAESDDKAAIRYEDPTGAGTLLEVRFGGGDKGAQGRVKTISIGRRRLVVYASLESLLTNEAEAAS
jgi:hypothetical protein